MDETIKVITDLLYGVVLIAVIGVLAGCAGKVELTKEQQIEGCVANMLTSSGGSAVYLTRATEACSHIYGLDHDRALEEKELEQ